MGSPHNLLKIVRTRRGLERIVNFALRPERHSRIGLGSDVIAGQGDVFPSQRGDMNQEIFGNRRSLSPQPLDDSVEIDRVPMNDGGHDEAQPRRVEALILEGSIPDFSLALEEHRRPGDRSFFA
jgi:hypothetical protein